MLYDPGDPPLKKAPPARPGAEDELFAKLAATPASSRARIRIGNVVIFAVAAITMAEIFYWWGGLRAAPRPAALIIETALGAACIAAVSMWALFGRGRSMLGRSALVLGVVGLLTPAALFAWKIFWSSQESGMMAVWPERAGFKCLRLSIQLGIVPLIAMALVRRNSDPNHPRLTGATLGVAAAACAWVFTDMWCPVAYVPHLLLGHVLPMAVLATIGALAGPWLIGVRYKQSAASVPPK